ncbi:hypothetical protein DFH06DRAFT_639852 [Mycena polygramma]|nr:hypothetical protein DFH06DRAFT_639852 [Mycena polygramma]
MRYRRPKRMVCAFCVEHWRDASTRYAGPSVFTSVRTARQPSARVADDVRLALVLCSTSTRGTRRAPRTLMLFPLLANESHAGIARRTNERVCPRAKLCATESPRLGLVGHAQRRGSMAHLRPSLARPKGTHLGRHFRRARTPVFNIAAVVAPLACGPGSSLRLRWPNRMICAFWKIRALRCALPGLVTSFARNLLRLGIADREGAAPYVCGQPMPARSADYATPDSHTPRHEQT